MRNTTLINTAKKILKDLLVQCTPEQQLMFKRMYCHTNLEASIEEAVDQMDTSKMDHAISQCERSIEKNNQKLVE